MKRQIAAAALGTITLAGCFGGSSGPYVPPAFDVLVSSAVDGNPAAAPLKAVTCMPKADKDGPYANVWKIGPEHADDWCLVRVPVPGRATAWMASIRSLAQIYMVNMPDGHVDDVRKALDEDGIDWRDQLVVEINPNLVWDATYPIGRAAPGSFSNAGSAKWIDLASYDPVIQAETDGHQFYLVSYSDLQVSGALDLRYTMQPCPSKDDPLHVTKAQCDAAGVPTGTGTVDIHLQFRDRPDLAPTKKGSSS